MGGAMASAGNAEHAAARAGHGPAAMEPDFRAIFEALPGCFLVLSPDLVILAASAAYLRASRVTWEGVIGRPILEVFPDRPDPGGLAMLRASLDRVMASREADTIAVRRYDLGPIGAEPDTRYWSLVNVPVLTPGGRLGYVIHWLDDVTELVRQAGERTGRCHRRAGRGPGRWLPSWPGPGSCRRPTGRWNWPTRRCTTRTTPRRNSSTGSAMSCGPRCTPCSASVSCSAWTT